MTYPIPFREHVLSVREKEGLTFEETSERFCVGIASLKRWSKRISPKPYDRKKVRKLDPDKLDQETLWIVRTIINMSARLDLGSARNQSGRRFASLA